MAETRIAIDAALIYLRRARRSVRFFKLLVTVLGAALLASYGWIEDSGFPQAERWSEIAFSVGLFSTAIGATTLVFIDEIAPDILRQNIHLGEKADTFEAQEAYLKGYIDHATARNSLYSGLREVTERALLEHPLDSAKLGRLCEAALRLMERRKGQFFGISDDYWNFAVYALNEERQRLECIACIRTGNSSGGGSHRDFAPDEGHVGLCFHTNNEITFSDATRPEVQSLIAASENNRRDYDRERYKSLTAVPISLDRAKGFGVLIATSNVIGRFQEEREREADDWDRAETLREVAAFLAIFFHLTDTDSRKERPNET